MEQLFELHELAHLAFHEAGDGHARPLAHDLGDVFGVDLFLEHALRRLQLREVLGRLGNATLELGNLAVADLGGAFEV